MNYVGTELRQKTATEVLKGLLASLHQGNIYDVKQLVEASYQFADEILRQNEVAPTVTVHDEDCELRGGGPCYCTPPPSNDK